MQPAISVIVPVFNTERYLRACVDSILSQTLTELEIVLVNDGSSDSSGDICDEYAAKYERVTAIHKENGGVSSARRAGVAAAKGQYIAFVDSDDWIEQDMYAQMFAYVREQGADVVMCDILFETSEGPVLQKNAVPDGLYCDRARQEIFATMLFHYEWEQPGVIPSLCSKLFRREIVERVLFDVDSSIVYGEDGLCSYPSLLDAERIYVMHRTLYHYRQNPTSATNSYDPDQLEKFLLLADEFERQFKQRGVDMERQLHGYVARFSLETVRNELLLCNDTGCRERQKRAKAYSRIPRIATALSEAVKEIGPGKTKTKMQLLLQGRIVFLHMLFLLRSIEQRLRRDRGR